MNAAGKALKGKVSKYSRLLGIHIECEDDQIAFHVDRCIKSELDELSIEEVVLNHDTVDWRELQRAACFRLAPFADVGNNEKGFRDALILETVAQLVQELPTTTILAFVTGDVLLAQAAKDRFTSKGHVRVYGDLTQLEGLITTFVDKVSEEVVNNAVEKCLAAFYDSKNPANAESYWSKLGVEPKVDDQFRASLAAERLLVTSYKSYSLLRPTLVEKRGVRWKWCSRIRRVYSCRELSSELEVNSSGPVTAGVLSSTSHILPATSFAWAQEPGVITGGVFSSTDPPDIQAGRPFGSWRTVDYEFTQDVDVIWEVTIQSNGKLRDPKLLEIRRGAKNKELRNP